LARLKQHPKPNKQSSDMLALVMLNTTSNQLKLALNRQTLQVQASRRKMVDSRLNNLHYESFGFEDLAHEYDI